MSGVWRKLQNEHVHDWHTSPNLIRDDQMKENKEGEENLIQIYKAESLFVCTLYKFTFLNQSEPNFAHISPLVGYVWTHNIGPFKLFDLFCWERVPIPG
jgi:hypothetical protein